MDAIVYASLAWVEAPMPGSSGPVRLARLPDVGDGGFRAFVGFLPGWERASVGHYAVGEMFLVLEGELVLGPNVIGAGGYGWFPASCTREPMRTPGGCLVHACFGGAPRWRRGAAAESPGGAFTWLPDWREAPADTAWSGARVLPNEPGRLCRMVEHGGTAPIGTACEVLSLADRGWRLAQPGTALPDAGPLLVRAIGPKSPTPSAF